MSSKEEKSLEKFNNYILNYFIFFLIQYLIYSSLALVNIKNDRKGDYFPYKNPSSSRSFPRLPRNFPQMRERIKHY